MNAVRFGRIHILDPDFVKQLKGLDAQRYIQTLEATLADERPSDANPWLHEFLWDRRTVIFTNTNTQDADRFEAFRRERWSKAVGGPNERRLADLYITENSHQQLWFNA